MYQWVLAFHIIAVICWFAALFYLPRLFVYHAMSEDEISIERFKVMQRKLYRGIANPSMIATIIFGLWLVTLVPAYLNEIWFQLKAGLVLLLIGYHHMCLSHMKRLAEDRNDKTHVYFRVFNEVPVLILVGIVILVVVKPF
ncbi:MAG: protoporphyrinogen oxidase HemJ [Porticoccaceae bacterium]|jgi:putative membrane protein|nr:protoporphyrinogen oxidase HemJ [Porticoccaceae bacterium]MDC0053941.1 protoporphyrinogen oxidase HemJ [Gammaproteobacteria bacterium]MBT4213467.1 protoporphyrinogen oxidase HemJ [Porticoccaceae bacterium]MBT5071708.1 protoporphyrinogen oxidase HemJ [Porticoccaceae bacterium]MBT6781068.1 protoporphyrinogen oxidase HemJ [Porticoccaceae bacterium]|tara:strand:- start:21044 stop:21466 length:423 start_codon:yes stop_codon:yes gene_type:complete